MNQYISYESLLDNDFFYYTDPHFLPQKKCKKNAPIPNEQYTGVRCLNENDQPNTFRLKNSEIDFIKNFNYFNKKNNCKPTKPIMLDFQNDNKLQKFPTFQETHSTFQKNASISQESMYTSQETRNLSQESTAVSQETNRILQESASVSQETQSTSQETQSISQESESQEIKVQSPKNIYYTVPQSFDTALYTAKLANIAPEKLISNKFDEQIIFDRSYNYSKNKRTFVDDIIENENLILIFIFVILCIYIFR